MTTLNYILIAAAVWLISIYNFNVTTLSGETISLEQYKDKKILLVNIAVNSPEAPVQLPELEKFYRLHKDSIEVVGFASNSFGNTPQSDAELSSIFQDRYHLSFPIAQKTAVTGTDAHPVYQWLQSAAENGITDAAVKKDFQKFLINRQGALSGLFSSATSVLSAKMQTAIQY